MLFFAATFNFELCFSACACAEYEINRMLPYVCTRTSLLARIQAKCLHQLTLMNPMGWINAFLAPCLTQNVFHRNGSRIENLKHSAECHCQPLEGYAPKKDRTIPVLFVIIITLNNTIIVLISFTGTAFSDTLCGNCTVGTYSDGSFTACLPYSNCEIKGLTEIKPGTMSSDVECGKSLQININYYTVPIQESYRHCEPVSEILSCVHDYILFVCIIV
ncbi:Tumor necrosis factor receptor superfamily member 5 [Labeo rohita]|uniref:Tumor necrosis factor receptor superfamily member 5 n=1 Tax=Labeo rohita TaxID=84645 RepID=A0ABQ8MIQ7_LABRO|nr:Tumor necrosis factor receptor superfamily member 5 [Labeo rohita]